MPISGVIVIGVLSYVGGLVTVLVLLVWMNFYGK